MISESKKLFDIGKEISRGISDGIKDSEARQKQIEELTNELIRTNSYGTLNAVAEHLYNAGYRKQIEGEWIWTENGEADCEKYWVCSVCKEHDFVKTKHCPNCGARMKGN